MTWGPGWRKLGLTVHVAASVGWIGAVVAYLGLVLAGLGSSDPQAVRSAWWGLDQLTGVLAPLSVAALVSGVVQALCTPWGLLRHYWVVVKLVLTAMATTVLLLTLPEVRAWARLAAGGQSPDLYGQLMHPGAGLLVLLVILALSVYKPRGLTPYGERRLWARLARRGTQN
ncbi:DUF2269 domain-containing protein [Deinococcus arcticus]|uniref:DUF2269 domain-containing protein n=1 Tax=Deinococcus arcticus TaxID=2136176 RepID=A0A2T3W3I4_9DEIO|nr:DUF2269 domain-containing protein [Deinococcus arcticus]PTA66460.1 DUF2269 domain-containing protein [Deinococcus arcticus]